MMNPQQPGAGDQPGGTPQQPPGMIQPPGPPTQPPGMPPLVPGVPQPGGAPQQPFGGQSQPAPPGSGQQPPGFGQQQYAPHDMQQMYGQPPYPPGYGGPHPPQPGKKRGTMVLVTLGLVVLVGGLGVVGFFLFSGGGGGSDDPHAVAQQFVDGSGEETKGLLCAADLAEIEQAEKSVTEPVVAPDVEVTKKLTNVDVADGSDRGTFTVEMDATVGAESHSQSVEYDLVREDGAWKVCGLLDASVPGGSGPDGRDSETDGSRSGPGGNSNGSGGSDSDSNGTGDSASGDVRAVAQQFVDSNGVDRDLICAADVEKMRQAEQRGVTPVELPVSPLMTRKITNVDVPEGSDKGTFTVELAIDGGSQEPLESLDYDLAKEDGAWKVCGIFDAWIS